MRNMELMNNTHVEGIDTGLTPNTSKVNYNPCKPNNSLFHSMAKKQSIESKANTAKSAL